VLGVVRERPRTPVWPASWARTVLLVLTLPMFAGLFQYVIDAPVLYGLSKVWPVLVLPLTLMAVLGPKPGYQPLLLATLAWLLAVVPFISMAQLGNDSLGAVASTAKIWPLSGALAGAAALDLLKPSGRELSRAVMMLCGLTFAFLVGAWLFAPDAAFNGTIETTKVFLSDIERGRRINAPMMFGILGLFVLNRSFWRRPALWKPVLIGLGLVAMVCIYKQRAQIAGTGLMLVLGAALGLGRWRGPALIALAAGGLASLIPTLLWLQGGSAAEGLGGSLTMRQTEAEAALGFLNDQPWRWITGVGSATRIGGVTMGGIVGTPFFFPSDLGWLGVVFEYGLIGAGLMLAMHLWAVRLAWRAAQGGGTLERALFDYALFLIVVSPIVSVVLSPGELATVLVLGWWLRTPSARPCAGSGS
jgi:O-antigen ligase